MGKTIRKKLYKLAAVFILVLTSLQFNPIKAMAEENSEAPFIRAFWVQAFEPGNKTPEQIDQLVQDVKDANMNTIVAQVSRRHDAYYHSDVLPFTQDPAVPQGFDPLGYLLEKAKENGIEVHAWVVVGPMWHTVYGGAPNDPEHIWNTNGPDAPENETWVTQDYNGTVPYWQPYLDLGHPDARNHVVDMVTDIVKNYDVDGVHLDYIRYPEDGKGYNPTSLARFQEETGRTDRPLPNDAEWISWKVEQVDTLIKRIYTELMAVNGEAELSAAVLSWGFANPNSTDWWQMDPVQRAHQNWKKWVQEGYLDYAYVMNYDSDADPRREERYNQWIQWQKDLERNRGIVIGPALYLNTISDSINQIHRALAPSQLGNMVEGVSPYVYNVWSNDGLPQQDLIRSLYEPTEHNDGNPPFTSPVPTPEAEWKNQSVGHLLGKVEDSSISREVTIYRGEEGKLVDSIKTDANGYFVLTDLQPGNYFVKVEGLEASKKIQISIQQVTEVTVSN
ncbi:glycoside hydrolase family 10 protein [Oceanobacillus saliphilus]|uniref:glycoside hydrolase family 10 protein n=1 Tax=Oceanobacillus saliphilus TaxID=2925834 RepID=UPI00201D8FFF|nr:family 10 glycosylhydrolase [Oceanobacillus saliphilus]